MQHTYTHQVARLAKLVGAKRFLAGEYLIDCDAHGPAIDFVIAGETYTLTVRVVLCYVSQTFYVG